MRPADPDTQGDLSVFEQSCAYCGARFRVLATRLPAEDAQTYACPECGKSYEVEAAAEPQVQLLRPRTDGKNDRYQETMF
jgi:predicted RNA-binding Zn-ribbon protein involved in translation (DUF1610 family)